MSGQRCAWPSGCEVTGRRLFCATHWGMLPRRIRRDLTALPDGAATPDEVIAYARRAITEAAAAAERAADLWRRQGVLFR